LVINNVVNNLSHKKLKLTEQELKQFPGATERHHEAATFLPDKTEVQPLYFPHLLY